MVEMFGHLYVGFSRSTPYAADSIIIIIIIATVLKCCAVSVLGSYIVGCLEHSEPTRCEETNVQGVEKKCYCSKNLCNSSHLDTIINPLLLLTCVSLAACTILHSRTHAQEKTLQIKNPVQHYAL